MESFPIVYISFSHSVPGVILLSAAEGDGYLHGSDPDISMFLQASVRLVTL